MFVTVFHNPIGALGGKRAREANEEVMKEWYQYTDSSFKCKMFNGGYFLYTGMGGDGYLRSKEMPAKYY